MTDAKKEYPPRVWASNTFRYGFQYGAEYVQAYKDRKFDDDIELISGPEIEALLREAKANTWIEAGNSIAIAMDGNKEVLRATLIKVRDKFWAKAKAERGERE